MVKVFQQTYGPCPKCGGIWFWSDFSAGALKCLECVPPPKNPKRGPGIIQPDGSLISAAEVTAHILDSGHRALIAGLVKILGPQWTYVKKPGLVIPLNIPIEVGSTSTVGEVPEELVIRPGDPLWVDRAVIERAIESHRRVEQTAESRPETTKGEVLASQLKRAALNPPKRKKGD